jgi:hypothetical protein
MRTYIKRTLGKRKNNYEPQFQDNSILNNEIKVFFFKKKNKVTELVRVGMPKL